MGKTELFKFMFEKDISSLHSSGQKALYILWNAAALLLSSAGVCVLSLFLAIGIYPIDYFFDYFNNPIILLLNWLPIFLMQFLLWCVLGRQWLSFLLSSLFFLGGSIANFYKFRLRYEPVVFSDLKLFRAALGVVSDFDLTPNVRILVSLVYIVAGALIMLLLVKGRFMRAWPRFLLSAAVLLSVFPLWHFVYSSDHIYNDIAVSKVYTRSRWTQEIYMTKGFVYPFLYSIKSAAGIPPRNYSEAEAVSLLSSYSDSAIPEDRKVNILAFQLEAFCDLEKLGIEDISPQAYSIYHALEEESFYGNLIVNAYGGTTIDAERCFLSGSYFLADFSKNSYSNVRYLRSQGYSAIGNHPFIASFYSRGGVDAALGFESYRFSDDYFSEILETDVWFPDAYFMPEVLSQYLDYARTGQPVFSFNVSTQGHGPYDDTRYAYDTLYWPGTGYSDEARYVINNYLGSVRDTQENLSHVIDALRSGSQPVVVLVYGDHKPIMGNNASILHELGINIDPSTPDGFLNYYSTRYLIWANEAAKEVLGDNLTGEGPDVSAGFLMNLLFDKLGWKGSAFNQFGNEIRQTLSVVTSNGYYYENGELTAELSIEGQEAFHQLEIVSYYVNRKYDNSLLAANDKG